MPKIQKLSSGKIFEDNFNLATINSIWSGSIVDNSTFSTTDNTGYLTIKNKYDVFSLLMDMPNSDFIFETKLDYIPTLTDEGGVVVYKNNSTKLELLSYKINASDTNIYSDIRIKKVGNVYTAYGKKSSSSNWEIIGTQYKDGMNNIGLTFKSNSPYDGTKSIKFDYVKIYRSNIFKVTNLDEDKTVQILNPTTNAVLKEVACAIGEDTVSMDLSEYTFPLNCKIKVIDGTGATATEEISGVIDIWGGDTYYHGYLVEVYDSGTILDIVDEYDLGNMVSGKIVKRLTLKNPSSYPINNVKIKASKLYENYGHNWVRFGIYNYTIPLPNLKYTITDIDVPNKKITLYPSLMGLVAGIKLYIDNSGIEEKVTISSIASSNTIEIAETPETSWISKSILTTSKEIIVSQIPANDIREIWVEIRKDLSEPIMDIGNYKFLLDISY